MENPFKAIPQKRIKNVSFLFISFYNTTPGKKVQYVKGQKILFVKIKDKIKVEVEEKEVLT